MVQPRVTGLEKRLANLRPYKSGQNRHTTKRERIDAKLVELVAELFRHGGYSRMDAARLRLAAQHYIDAETCRDPVTRQRATRCAEYLLSKLKPPTMPRPPAGDQAEQALAFLNKSLDGV